MNALKLAKEHRIRKTWKELWDGVQQMTPAQLSLVCHMTLSYALHVHIFFCSDFLGKQVFGDPWSDSAQKDNNGRSH